MVWLLLWRKASVCPVPFVEFLLYRGKADLTVLDENKNTALHLACSKVLPRAGSGKWLRVAGWTAPAQWSVRVVLHTCPLSVLFLRAMRSVPS